MVCGATVDPVVNQASCVISLSLSLSLSLSPSLCLSLSLTSSLSRTHTQRHALHLRILCVCVCVCVCVLRLMVPCDSVSSHVSGWFEALHKWLLDEEVSTGQVVSAISGIHA